MDFPHCTRRQALRAFGGLMTWLATTASAHAAPTVSTRQNVILVLGDSLSAEYGLARGSGWVALLEQRLTEKHLNAKVINASVSGETTAGGLTRLPALLAQHQPTHVIIELGANDALRGLALVNTQANLLGMIRLCKNAKARPMLTGMQVPPNLGRRYTSEFAELFPAIAKAESVALVPFLLAGVADQADTRNWFQADATHPLAKAHPIILDNVWRVLEPLLLGRQR